MEWVSDWKQGKKERMGRWEARERTGEGGEGETDGKGHVQSGYENCIFPRHTWGERGTYGRYESSEVLPGFACIVRYRDFL